MNALTSKQWEARAQCFEECANHLCGDWTEDGDEREQSEAVVKWLYRKALEMTKLSQQVKLGEEASVC